MEAIFPFWGRRTLSAAKRFVADLRRKDRIDICVHDSVQLINRSGQSGRRWEVKGCGANTICKIPSWNVFTTGWRMINVAQTLQNTHNNHPWQPMRVVVSNKFASELEIHYWEFASVAAMQHEPMELKKCSKWKRQKQQKGNRDKKLMHFLCWSAKWTLNRLAQPCTGRSDCMEYGWWANCE